MDPSFPLKSSATIPSSEFVCKVIIHYVSHYVHQHIPFAIVAYIISFIPEVCCGCCCYWWWCCCCWCVCSCRWFIHYIAVVVIVAMVFHSSRKTISQTSERGNEIGKIRVGMDTLGYDIDLFCLLVCLFVCHWLFVNEKIPVFLPFWHYRLLIFACFFWMLLYGMLFTGNAGTVEFVSSYSTWLPRRRDECDKLQHTDSDKNTDSAASESDMQ